MRLHQRRTAGEELASQRICDNFERRGAHVEPHDTQVAVQFGSHPLFWDLVNFTEHEYVTQDTKDKHDARDDKRRFKRAGALHDEASDDWRDDAHQVVDKVHDATYSTDRPFRRDQRWNTPTDGCGECETAKRNGNPNDSDIRIRREGCWDNGEPQNHTDDEHRFPHARNIM